MTSFTPSPAGQRLLAALALPNQHATADRANYWSVNDLQTDPRTYAEFRSQSVRQITGTAGALVRQGLARSRRVGTLGHGWTEYRITNTGQAWVDDQPATEHEQETP